MFRDHLVLPSILTFSLPCCDQNIYIKSDLKTDQSLAVSRDFKIVQSRFLFGMSPEIEHEEVLIPLIL